MEIGQAALKLNEIQEYSFVKNPYDIARRIAKQIIEVYKSSRSRTPALKGKSLKVVEEILTFELGNFLIATQHFISLADKDSEDLNRSLRTRTDSAKCSYQSLVKKNRKGGISEEIIDQIREDQYWNPSRKANGDVKATLLRISSQMANGVCYSFFGKHWSEISVLKSRSLFEGQRALLIKKLRMLSEVVYGDKAALDPILDEVHETSGRLLTSDLQEMFTASALEVRAYDSEKSQCRWRFVRDLSDRISTQDEIVISVLMKSAYAEVLPSQIGETADYRNLAAWARSNISQQ